MFTDSEIAYIRSQPLARLATISAGGQPDVSPVGFEFDGRRFFIGGHHLDETRKYRNVREGNGKVALVIDDLVSVQPWHPRGLRVYGTTEVVERDGHLGHGTYLQITPSVSWSWNVIEPDPDTGRSFRRAEHQGEQ